MPAIGRESDNNYYEDWLEQIGLESGLAKEMYSAFKDRVTHVRDSAEAYLEIRSLDPDLTPIPQERDFITQVSFLCSLAGVEQPPVIAEYPQD